VFTEVVRPKPSGSQSQTPLFFHCSWEQASREGLQLVGPLLQTLRVGGGMRGGAWGMGMLFWDIG